MIKTDWPAKVKKINNDCVCNYSTIKEVIKAFYPGISIETLADELCTNRETLRLKMKELGIKINPSGWPRKAK